MYNRDPFNLRRTSPISQIGRLSPSSPLFAAAGVSFSQAIAQVSTKAQEAATLVQEKVQEVVSEGVENMAFAIPRNVPSFTNPQRQSEDMYWAASSSSSSRGGTTGGSVFKGNGDLPLYKDKPYYASRRKRDLVLKKRVLAGVVALLLLGFWFFGTTSPTDRTPQPGGFGDSKPWSLSKPRKGSGIDWSERRERVKDAFVVSWSAYEDSAWGFDQFHPVSRKGTQMTPKGMGWIIVDALDTLMIMNLTTQLAHAREWVTNTLDYDQDQEVNTFETTIRMLGGLLSAHYLSSTFGLDPGAKATEDMYLEKSADLADKLLAAYASRSGVPFASVNLKNRKGVVSHADGGASSTAEATTLQLEMKYLAQLMGEVMYWDKAENVMKVIDDNMMPDGLLPIFVYADTGHFRGSEIRLGSRGDSYYEYLLKQYLQTNLTEPIYSDMFQEALAGVKKHMVRKSQPNGFTYIGELPGGVGGSISPKMDHLVCFMPGTILLSVTNGVTIHEKRASGKWTALDQENYLLAVELTKSCYEMYRTTPTGLAPEIAWFNTDPHGKDDIIIKPQDAHNLQRPETVESLFMMWRLTEDEIYREWGWNIFQAFMNHSIVEDGGGFTSLDSVLNIPVRKRDNMESFWLAETLKYLYLLFSPNDLLPLTQVVFNTEAHPLPIFKPKSLLKTGWTRKPRGGEPQQNHAPAAGATSTQVERVTITRNEAAAPTPEA